MARYPEIRVSLRTPNAVVLVAAVRSALRRAGVPREEIRRFSTEALGDKDPVRMRAVCARWVDTESRSV